MQRVSFMIESTKQPKNSILHFILKHRCLNFIFIFLLSFTLSGAAKKPLGMKVPIFGFHDIVDPDNKDSKSSERAALSNDYKKQNFEIFLNYLVENDYWFLTSQELFVYFIQKSKPIPKENLNRKPIMLTFDDGYESVHQTVLPFLKDLEKKYQEQVKIVLFINPKTLGVKIEKFIPHLTCQQLREGYKLGYYDVQSHGYSHQKLTRLKSQFLKTDLEQAKTGLRSCLADLDPNQWVGAHISYPHGAVSRHTERYLPGYHLTGYLYDGVISRPNRLRNPFRISRVRVNRYTTPRQLIRVANRATRIKSPVVK